MSWADDEFCGFLARANPLPRRAADPAVEIYSAELVGFGTRPRLPVGGAGWDQTAARAAAVGEAVERWMACPIPSDDLIEARYCDLDQAAVAPDRWVMFHPDQDVPFEPLTEDSLCRWMRFRRPDGEPVLVPDEFACLFLESGRRNRFTPGLSTGLACGRTTDPVVLRGLQELVERDATIGAWWGRYALAPVDDLLEQLAPADAERLDRPNLTYRGYHIRTPHAHHVVMVTLSGLDDSGPLFAVGSACRSSRQAAWRKAAIEAVQSRHYARWLMQADAPDDGPPRTFADHAAYYSRHPERLDQTPFAHAPADRSNSDPASDLSTSDGGDSLANGADPLTLHEPLVRLMTPPAAAARGLRVVRVLVPGLQPLHGDHLLPHLGGPLWERPVGEWANIPPHPFP